MPAKLTPETFLSVLKQSGLIESARLQRILQNLKDQGYSLDDANLISEALVDGAHLTRWQADKLLKGMFRGFFLGKYCLLSLLGKGGMSSVYLAEHVLMRRRCALKVLPFKRLNDSHYVARFHREAQAVAALDDPNIVRAYDVDVDKDVDKNREVHFLVMEYVNGFSLHELVARDGQIDFIKAADYIRQSANGLQHAHDAGLVHRDVKPANLLVDKNGVVKILDLGLARFFSDDENDGESLTEMHDQKVLGTADFLAPEQALDSHSVDTRADIYGLGCTFFYILSGRAPFSDGTLAQRLMSHQVKEPPPLNESRPDAPAELVEIVRKMMAKDPGNRYQTAADVSDVLLDWLQKNAGEGWSPDLRVSDSKAEISIPSELDGKPSVFSERLSDSEMGAPTVVSSNVEEVSAPSEAENGEELASFLSSLDIPKAVEPEAEPAAPVPESEEQPAPVAQIVGSPESDDGSPEIPLAQPVESSPPVAEAVPVAKPVTAFEVAAETQVSETPDFQSSGPSTTSRKNAGKPRKRNKTAFLAGGVILLLCVAGLAFFLLSGDDAGSGKTVTATKSKKKKTSKSKPEPKRVNILPREISVGPTGDFQTISEAIAKVKETFQPRNRRDKQIIKVQGGATYPERLVLDNSDLSFDDVRIHLISDGPQPAILAPPAGDAPLIQLTDVKQFQLEGFELNVGGGKTGIEMSGFLRGTAFRDLKITHFSDAGIVGNAPAGYGVKDGVIRLEKIDFREAAPGAYGIRFPKGEGDPTQIVIEKCRFLGPMAGGLRFQGGAAFLTIQHSIFSEMGTGIQFEATLPKLRELRIERNTFCQLKSVFSMTGMPQTYPDSNENAIRKNLFVNITGPEAIIQNGFNESNLMRTLTTNGLTENWSTRPESKKPGKNELDLIGGRGKTDVKPQFRSRNPDEQGYLLPAPTASHRFVGASPSDK